MFIGNSPWFYHVAKGTVRSLVAPFFSLEVAGLNNLTVTPPLIMLPKHQRWEDIPLLSLASPLPLHYVAKYELFQNPVSRQVLTSLGGIPLNRKKPVQSRQSFQHVVDLLNNGHHVVIFPEGTYFPNTIGRGHSGMIRFISKRIPAVTFMPVGIRYVRTPLRTRAQIRFGCPRRIDGPDMTVDGFLKTMLGEIAHLSGLDRQTIDCRS